MRASRSWQIGGTPYIDGCSKGPADCCSESAVAGPSETAPDDDPIEASGRAAELRASPYTPSCVPRRARTEHRPRSRSPRSQCIRTCSECPCTRRSSCALQAVGLSNRQARAQSELAPHAPLHRTAPKDRLRSALVCLTVPPPLSRLLCRPSSLRVRVWQKPRDFANAHTSIAPYWPSSPSDLALAGACGSGLW